MVKLEVAHSSGREEHEAQATTLSAVFTRVRFGSQLVTAPTPTAKRRIVNLYDPQRAIDRVLHVLKPGGVCIASTRFLYRYHPDPKDYYRFTWDSLEYLFRRFSHVEVHHHGSRVQAIWEMINAGGRSRVLLNILNPFFALFEFQQTRFPLGFVIYAQK